MCILLISAEHPDYDLILLSNRDEYFDRATRALHWWPIKEGTDHLETRVLAGQDAERQGTWLALTSTGKFSVLTNFRESTVSMSTKSRGSLPVDFVVSPLSVDEHLNAMISKGKNSLEEYGGFSLLCGDLTKLNEGFKVLSNRSATHGIVSVMTQPRLQDSRRHAESNESKFDCACELSNAEISNVWPKTKLGKRLLQSAIASSSTLSEPQLIERLFEILSTDTLSEHTIDAMKGSIFIPQVQIPGGGTYGTRQHTVVLVKAGRVKVIERTRSHQTLHQTEVSEEFILPQQAS